MRLPITPTQLEDAGKALGGLAVICSTVLGLWKPVGRRYQAWKVRREEAKAAAAKAIADRLIEDQREAARRVAQELRTELTQTYELGQRHMLDTIASIRDLMGDHTLNDEKQFTELREQARGLREQQVDLRRGQEQTHEALAEMKDALKEADRKLETTDRNLAEINGSLKVIIQERRR
jgi:hypothetical protein